MSMNSWIWSTIRPTHPIRECCGLKNCPWNARKRMFANISAVGFMFFGFRHKKNRLCWAELCNYNVHLSFLWQADLFPMCIWFATMQINFSEKRSYCLALLKTSNWRWRASMATESTTSSLKCSEVRKNNSTTTVMPCHLSRRWARKRIVPAP